MSNFSKIELYKHKWHKNKFPTEDTIVIGQVKSIDTNGVFFQILDYSNLGALMALNQVSSKRIKTVKSIFKENDIRPVLVTKVDEKTGYVDLSNKYLNKVQDDIDRLDKYAILIKIMKAWMMKMFGDITDENWNQIMELTLWKYPLGDIYDHFMDIKTDKKTILDIFPDLSSTVTENFLLDFKKIINTQIFYEIEISVKVIIKSFSSKSLDQLKNVCTQLQDKIQNCKLFINSPQYTFIVKSHQKEQMEKLFESIEKDFDTILKNPDIEYSIEKNISIKN